MIHWLLARIDSKQDILDLFEDGAIELTAGRSGGMFPEEADSASQKALEVFLVDQFAQVFGVPCCGKNEHVTELSASEVVN
jgi:hypothetical protein